MEINQYEIILETQNLSLGYESKKDKILISKDLHLQIYKGELLCLLGPNGCGKSTLIRTLAGMQKPLGGSIFFMNKLWNSITPKQMAMHMSVVLTDVLHVPAMTVYDVVALGRHPHTNIVGRLSEHDTESIYSAIESVGLKDFEHRLLSSLSDGERQRAMIARALAQDTPFILLDEPTAHLDLPNRIEVMQLLKNLASKYNKSILLSTHELDLALQVADRIWLMQRGKDIICGTPEDLVLQGDFERAFKKHTFTFDISNGMFKIANNYSKKVSMKGNSIYSFWTNRALHRYGIEVVGKHDAYPHIHIQDSEWIISYGNTTYNCNSIFNLLIVLNSIV